MNYKILLSSILIGVFFCSTNLMAQTATKVHQSFSLNNLKNITIDILYPYTIEKWDGNTVLLETSIDIDNAPPSLLKMFLNSERYKIFQQEKNNTIQYTLKSMPRKEVLTSKGPCTEKIHLHFYIPKNVIVRSLGNFVDTKS